MRGARLLAGVVSIIIISLGATAAALILDKARNLDLEEVFVLIDRFDPLDTSSLPFVEVSTGRWVSYDDAPPVNTYRYGFLLDDRDGRFTVRGVDLGTEILAATGGGAAEHERVGHAGKDMGAHAVQFAARLAADDSTGNKLRFYVTPHSTMEPRAEALLLARACRRRGLSGEAEALVKAAGDLQKALGEIADGLRYQLSMSFADPDVSRAELLERYRLWLRSFPGDWHRQYVEPEVASLERVVAEDRAREGGAGAAGEPLEGDELVASLIRALRDEYYPVQDRSAESGEFVPTTAVRPPPGTRPSERLRDLGFQAAPTLIEAVTDDTFTRCVWYSSRYGGSFEVLTVGVFASDILEEISGMTFYGKPEERRDAWRSWWASVSAKGEEAALAELAARGDHSSPSASRRLLERWPGRHEPVIEGMRRARNSWVRGELVRVLSVAKEGAVTSALLEEVSRGPHVSGRVEAAGALLDRGRREGLDSFLEEWAGAPASGEPPGPGAPRDLERVRDEARRAMAGFLLGSGDLRAVRTVARDLLGQPQPVRSAVLESIDDLGVLLGRADPPSKPAIEREIEGILIVLLDDLHRTRASCSRRLRDRWVSFCDPRNADLAAIRLATTWPERYDFDPTVPTRLRDRRILGLKNAWRRTRGLEPLPESPRPDVRSRDPGVVTAIGIVADALDAAKRREGIVRLETFGLGALPWIEDRLRDLPRDHAAREDLEALANRLANRVCSVAIECKDEGVRRAVEARVVDLEGKPLDPDVVVDVWLHALRCLHGAGRIHLEADRLGDWAGVDVRIRIDPASGEGRSRVQHSHTITAAGRTVDQSWGSGAYDDAREAIASALSRHRHETFEILLDGEAQ